MHISKWSLSIAIALMLTMRVSGQQPPIVSVPFEGTEAFGHILHSRDLLPVPTIAAAKKLDPAKTLIVVFGELSPLHQLDEELGLDKFRAAGGAILVASDYASIRLGKRLALQWTIGDFLGRKVEARGESRYQGQWNECPVVSEGAFRDHPLFDRVGKGLATNRPTYLLSHDDELPVLARFSDDCVYTATLGGQKVRANQNQGYILGSPKDALPGGRMVVIAGQGMFMNGMLIQTDCDNFGFSMNLVRWLSEGPDGPREHALFIDERNPVTNFALPLSKFGNIPVPPVQVINRMLRGLEDENAFNRLLIEGIGKPRILRGLLLAASVVLLFLGGRRLILSRHRLDTRAALVVGKDEAVPPGSPVLYLRQEELERDGNFWEPAQVLARQFFLDHAGAAVPFWDEDVAGPPKVEAGGSFWERARLTRHVRVLWDMARAAPTDKVSKRRFEELTRLIADTTAAVDVGRLRFVS